MFSLKDQVAVVMGGAKGIGKGIVEALTKQEAQVILLDIDEETGQETADEFQATFMACDITDRPGVRKTVQKIKDEFQRIDILAANTGIYPEILLKDLSEEQLDQIFDINVKGMFNICQAVLEVMAEEEYGRVIITSSITGAITGYPGGTAYGATKAANLGFMRNAAVEFADKNITVNAVQPGVIATESLMRELPTLNEGAKYIPAKTLGEPMDIGATVAFLASKEAKYITGQSLVVDGGQILPETPDVIA